MYIEFEKLTLLGCNVIRCVLLGFAMSGRGFDFDILFIFLVDSLSCWPVLLICYSTLVGFCLNLLLNISSSSSYFRGFLYLFKCIWSSRTWYFTPSSRFFVFIHKFGLFYGFWWYSYNYFCLILGRGETSSFLISLWLLKVVIVFDNFFLTLNYSYVTIFEFITETDLFLIY